MTRDDDAERGSLPMVMLVMMIGLALGAVLVPTVLVQSRSTVFTTNRQNALHAAQAGVDTAIGRIRATSPDGGTADTTKLPCTTPTAPVSGPVAGAGAESFAAQITYYVSDPVKFPSATPMTCVSGKGVYDSSTGVSAPAYARITSVGTDGDSTGTSRTRTIASTYALQTTNANVAGGQIRIYPPDTNASTPRMCMDAGGNPVVGTVLTLQTCDTSNPVAARQVFEYRTDLTLHLARSASTGDLCLDTDATAGTTAPTSGNNVVLRTCAAAADSQRFRQQWSATDNSAYDASTSTTASSGATANLCMDVADQNAGTAVKLLGCNSRGGGSRSPYETWVPAPSVGAGGAGAPQLVNYLQFGRCLDVTGSRPDNNHLILYPCKQNPQPTAVHWNEKFTYEANTGWLSTVDTDTFQGAGFTNVKFCLYSPRTESGWVRMTKCDTPGWVSGVTADQLVWTSTGADLSVPYVSRYRFVDSGSTPRCLTMVTKPVSDPDVWDYAGVATCNGGAAQKWNADPRIGAPTVQDTTEKVGAAG